MVNNEQNILLVDDHPENLIALEAILEDVECNLLKANSGNEALALLLKHEVALVLLDVQMPGMDGFEVAELMRKSKRTQMVPIIFVTAISKEAKYVARGYGVGAIDYMFKPLNPEILQHKAKFFLDLDMQKRRLEEKLRKSQESKEAFLKAMGEAGEEPAADE
ncbi:MAG: response regulator [Moraxellaceae bacterium]|nr:response regulator [Moraxellaceae bacterium]